MANNLEIKATCPNLLETESIVKKIATEYKGIDSQIDTYFNTNTGRFKLRESSLSGSYLIPYIRPDKTETKLSLYDKIIVSDSENVKSLFTQLLGIHCVVKKKRIIYLYENVRIHLDQVENLGTFIEFEAVFDEINKDEKEQKKKISYLMQQLRIKKGMLIASSYEQLLINKTAD
ncbi:MAG: class IV adenylate cyclase [Calditrichia bacterium]|nr:class IV adenylate cyclase [Calditrichia bacterium]